ncbi:NAD(P)H-flavin reductase [Bradyrhizobium sp. USDA 4518]|nr:NAD(P)H-flavin reductase [Bradyrhizobium sp. USDA 4545]MCP1916434.1 NAD(P)H-flavin reductase [Bradyrhizobium sp. USDA 4532]
MAGMGFAPCYAMAAENIRNGRDTSAVSRAVGPP